MTEWVEIIFDDEPGEHKPYIEPTYASVLDRISGSRTTKLIAKAKAIQSEEGDFTRHELILSGLTDYYFNEGLKHFSRLDKELQIKALLWFKTTLENPGPEVEPLAFCQRKFTCDVEYGGSYNIMLNRWSYFGVIENHKLTRIGIRELYNFYDPEGLQSNVLNVDAFHYKMTKIFSFSDCLKAALGLVSQRKWRFEG
jgi:hypothetical protein